MRQSIVCFRNSVRTGGGCKGGWSERSEVSRGGSLPNSTIRATQERAVCEVHSARRGLAQASEVLEEEQEDDLEAVVGAAEADLLADGSYLHATALEEPFGCAPPPLPAAARHDEGPPDARDRAPLVPPDAHAALRVCDAHNARVRGAVEALEGYRLSYNLQLAIARCVVRRYVCPTCLHGPAVGHGTQPATTEPAATRVCNARQGRGRGRRGRHGGHPEAGAGGGGGRGAAAVAGAEPRCLRRPPLRRPPGGPPHPALLLPLPLPSSCDIRRGMHSGRCEMVSVTLFGRPWAGSHLACITAVAIPLCAKSAEGRVQHCHDASHWSVEQGLYRNHCQCLLGAGAGAGGGAVQKWPGGHPGRAGRRPVLHYQAADAQLTAQQIGAAPAAQAAMLFPPRRLQVGCVDSEQLRSLPWPWPLSD